MNDNTKDVAALFERMLQSAATKDVLTAKFAAVAAQKGGPLDRSMIAVLSALIAVMGQRHALRLFDAGIDSREEHVQLMQSFLITLLMHVLEMLEASNDFTEELEG